MQETKYKIIFLDIDGVVCTPRSHIAYGHGIWMREFDPLVVKMVNKLCLLTGAKIVISSTWRRDDSEESMGRIRKAFGEHLMPDQHLKTPIDKQGAARGVEIEEWFNTHTLAIEKWVILDDDSDMQEFQLSHFVHIKDFEVGMTARDFRAAYKILTGENYSHLKAEDTTISDKT